MQQVMELRRSVAHMYDKKCYICEKPIKKAKRFLYHHKWYEPTDKTYKNFKTQLAYHKYVIKRVKAQPSQFLLLCNGCHFDIMRKRLFAPERFDRLKAVALYERGRNETL